MSSESSISSVREDSAGWIRWNLLAPSALAVTRIETFLNWYVSVVREWWRIPPLLILPHSRIYFRFADGTDILCTSPRDWAAFLGAVHLNLLQKFMHARPGIQRDPDGTAHSVLEFDMEGRTLRFRYDRTPREVAIALSEIFLFGEYDSLPVAGKSVVDIGAHWADSAIYFVTRGAREVLAYEASPSAYRRGEENVHDNGMEGLIHSQLASCGCESGRIRVPDDGMTPGTWQAVSAPGGSWVDRTTLPEIASNLSGSHASLKVDCEGCEYDLFSCPSSALDPFDEVVVEYHRGPSPIVAALRGAGFSRVRNTFPKRLPHNLSSGQALFGLVRASR